MEFSGVDETISCVDCKQKFLFTANDQEFFKSKGFDTKPKRCKPCRELKKMQNAGGAPRPGPAATPAPSYSEPWQDEQRRGGGRRGGKKKHARGR